jgi:hypothetical protein
MKPPNPNLLSRRRARRSRPSEREAVMTILTKNQALGVIRRAYGSDRAESLADRLPERADLENPADRELLVPVIEPLLPPARMGGRRKKRSSPGVRGRDLACGAGRVLQAAATGGFPP